MKGRDKRGRFLRGFEPWDTGKNLSKGIKEKVSKTRKRLFEEGGLKIWNKGKKLTERHKQSISRTKKEFFRKHPEVAMQWGRSIHELWKNNPELKKSANEKRKKTMRTEEFRKRMSSIKKKQCTTSEFREKMRRIKNRQYKTNPELKKKIDKIITGWWRDNPAARKRQSQRIRQFFIKNPKAFEEFMKHGKNPLKPHLRTSQGFIVRSKGEQQIANFLEKNKIPSLYESFSLPITSNPYKGNICTPDFYIPSLNIFIEFYGGYPLAWKKKVLKNKLYKAHKIPVLAITPAELENLDYYLIRQGKQLSQTEIAKEFDVKKWIR